jgi:dipeptidyl aminopeptidase/acylaminoacyl peptidase
VRPARRLDGTEGEHLVVEERKRRQNRLQDALTARARGPAGRRGGRAFAALAAALALALGVAEPAAAQLEPPADVIGLLEAPPLPRLLQDPEHRYALLVHEHQLLPSEHLAEPAVSVMGVKVNPRTYGRHAPLAYFALTLVDLSTGRETPLDVPDGAVIGFPHWAADGSRFAFTATVSDGIELWIGDPALGRVRRLLGPELNGALGAPCTWMPDNRRLLCRLIDGEKRRFPTSQGLADLFRLTAPTTMQSLSQSSLDPWMVRQLLEAQLALIDSHTGLRQSVGSPAAVDAVEPAPSGAFLLVSRILPPYPQVSGVERVLKTIEVWDRYGHVVRTFPAAGSQPNAPRAMQWHASLPATLVWAERYGENDRLMTLGPPFTDMPAEVFRTPHRYAGLDWLEHGNDALVSDYDAQRRMRRHWLVSWGRDEARLLAESSVDSAYARFGRPMTEMNRRGKEVVRVHDGAIFLRGISPGEAGAVAYVDRMDLATLATERLWESDGRVHETVLGLLAPDASALLTRRETSREPPNYFAQMGGELRAITRYEHPAPALATARRIPLRFERPDGLRLSANLFLPAVNDSLQRLPVILWAYPRVYGEDTQAVEPVAGEQFPSFERAFKLFYLLSGYAVLDDVSMPIVGSAATANDTFIEQIVTNAHAAIEAAAATGFVDPERVGVAGHSYGAFMVANLLAHSNLFGAGAALSGAYNRTLTPFGFQTERRSLWEARDTYLAMSPFLYSNMIDEPLLLVHGLLDENAGTPPIQSIQFYEAIRHNGGNADILLLPREGHSYRGRESVLATAATLLAFFDAHLKPAGDVPTPGTLSASATAVEPGGQLPE